MRYRFDAFELDTVQAELRSGGVPSPVEPQVFALLTLLVEHCDRLVSRDEILDTLWSGRVISDAALASRVKSARRALGDDGKSQRFIRTVHGKGYRFVAPVRIEHTVQPLDPPVAVAGASQPVEATGRPSIAVLPFRLMGNAGRFAAIADALPHELIVELARLRWLFVTARGSSFRFREPQADPREVGRLLGVRYCLSGTVEVARRSLNVTVELVETQDGGILWSDRFAGPVDDVHGIRDDIRSHIISALDLRIPLHEASLARLKDTDNLDAWSAYHLGLQHMYHFNRPDNAAASSLFRRAVQLDPGFARAHAGLSFVHFQNAFMRHTDDVDGESARARSCAERGIELDPLDPFTNFTMGRSHWLSGDLEGGLTWLERATAISPNYAQGIYAQAWTETLAGRGLQGREHVDRSMRLSPLDPLFYAMLGTRAFSHLVVGEDEAAAMWAERAALSPGAHVLIAMIACAMHAIAGDAGRAAHWQANVLSRNAVLTRHDFFRSFPIKSDVTRARVAGALERFGF